MATTVEQRQELDEETDGLFEVYENLCGMLPKLEAWGVEYFGGDEFAERIRLCPNQSLMMLRLDGKIMYHQAGCLKPRELTYREAYQANPLALTIAIREAGGAISIEACLRGWRFSRTLRFFKPED